MLVWKTYPTINNSVLDVKCEKNKVKKKKKNLAAHLGENTL